MNEALVNQKSVRVGDHDLFLGPVSPDGYPMVYLGDGQWQRIAVRHIPTCRYRNCINPNHLCTGQLVSETDDQE